jgi:hypothetical protein
VASAGISVAARGAAADDVMLSMAEVARVCSGIFKLSPSFSSNSSNTALCAELAEALVKFHSWSDAAIALSVRDLRNAVCSLCSFRNLQKRLQVTIVVIV